MLIIHCLTVQNTVCWAVSEVCANSSHLFYIERSKNANIVYYDICLKKNGELSDSNAALAYWVLESGKKEELGLIDRTFAYGILSLEKTAVNRARFSIAALKRLQFTIENISKEYKAVASINNREIIIEKIYVSAKENYLGLPKVVYVDIYGWTRGDNVPVRERLLPE